MKFVCKNCNYRFETKNEKGATYCPYCGEKKVIPEANASELLEEVE
jgi:DNA-directed RNA polymerase subunit RPC12/RpoP